MVSRSHVLIFAIQFVKTIVTAAQNPTQSNLIYVIFI